jgi:hypothetical protein
MNGIHSQDIKKVKDLQVVLVDCQDAIQRTIKKLAREVEKYIKQECEKEFPGMKVHFLTGFEGGCFTGNWNADVFFYSVNDFDIHGNSFYEVYADDLPRGQVRKVESPIAMNKLKTFVKRMSAETGAHCKLCQSTYVGRCLRGEYKDVIDGDLD